jgi:hypothetical protein
MDVGSDTDAFVVPLSRHAVEVTHMMPIVISGQRPATCCRSGDSHPARAWNQRLQDPLL